MRTSTLTLLLLLAAVPASAFHRTTPAIVQLTAAGDNTLPRLSAFGNKLVVAIPTGGGLNLFRYTHGQLGGIYPLTSGSDMHENPSANAGASIIAWDEDCEPSECLFSGRQIFTMTSTGVVEQITQDPTGTSANPALSGSGRHLAFESQGNLAGGSNGGAREIFVYTKSSLAQVSSGAGDSRNPVLSRSGRLLAYDSTSHPVTGIDTNVSQIWLAPSDGEPMPITAGAGNSRLPALSDDGKLVAFESTADLAGNDADTGVPQVFAYEVRKGVFHRLTNHPSGCTGPNADDIARDWRVAFSCAGRAYIHNVRANTRFVVPILDVGDTPRIAPELGTHFVVVSTTANLTGMGTTPGHLLYLLNLFKLPFEATASDAITF